MMAVFHTLGERIMALNVPVDISFEVEIAGLAMATKSSQGAFSLGCESSNVTLAEMMAA
jgi:hypothetical protein